MPPMVALVSKVKAPSSRLTSKKAANYYQLLFINIDSFLKWPPEAPSLTIAPYPNPHSPLRP